MSTKYTQGPWRVGDAGFSVFGPPNGTPSPETIATVRKSANARLIAAAPELLEALKAVLEHHGYRPDGLDFPKAWKAIAKAEGKE